jgi:hypothetical protein
MGVDDHLHLRSRATNLSEPIGSTIIRSIASPTVTRRGLVMPHAPVWS